jgi:predicted TIM-barrel fold metal-dependent hydrolase
MKLIDKWISLPYFLLAVLVFLLQSDLSGQERNAISTIPRIDVHAHIGSMENMVQYMEVRRNLKEQYDTDLAMWIDLSFPLEPGGGGVDLLKASEDRYGGRFLPTINDYEISNGLRFSPEELPEWMERGVVGYKMWVGVSPAIDHPANDPTFTKMEQIGMIGASVHISQPYPRNCKDPVRFWESVNAWERVLDRHPELIVVNAHMMNLFYSDEQLDYLQYFLDTYPNVYIDIAARFKDFYSMSHEKLRDFFIKNSDRILFGTDISTQPGEGEYREMAEAYHRCFEILETDGVFEAGFFPPVVEGKTIQGISLPVEVLEKIYYKNAMKLYPRVREVMENLGYHTDELTPVQHDIQ